MLMSTTKKIGQSLLAYTATALLLSLIGFAAAAADYPAPKEGDWIARPIRFHTGDVIPELRLHYTTVGEPSGQPVLILHGTTGSGNGLLSPTFADE
jgi:homoserine O-acetyltransferase/O-succinyltransferase